jgi:hypothetical protein
LNDQKGGSKKMSSQMLRRVISLGAIAALLVAGSAVVIASDPLDGAKGFDAIGIGQPASIPTCPSMGPVFVTDIGELRGEPVGKAQYQLQIPSCLRVAGGGGGPFAGQLILTKDDSSTLVLDVVVSTSDGGITYLGTYSAPSYNGTTSAVSTRKFQGVFGTGEVVFGTGLNPTVFPASPANAPTLHIAGTLVFPN